jgi:prepilin-type N-terminal cleavage/methylation domain-containing protein
MRAKRNGLTLVELLVVLVVLGILSGIAIARFVSTKEAAYVATMKSDLRNFALYEQNYVIESQGSYFAGNGTTEGFVPTLGVSVTATANIGPPANWFATATHNRTPKTCSISAAGSSIGEITCP